MAVDLRAAYYCGASIALAAIFVGCANKPPAKLRVSQSATDLSLIQRVQGEAQAACANDDGQRGVTWPYPTLPGGNDLGDYQEPVIHDSPPPVVTVAPQQVHGFVPLAMPRPDPAAALMHNMANGVQRAFRYQQSDLLYEGAESPVYTCKDGVQIDSKAFVFVP